MFNLPSPADFERAAKSIYGELFADYGDLPRNAAGEKIYESTPYPPDQMILFHNESSHLPSFPMKISFHCVTPAKKGGCAPIFDTREVLKHIDPAVVDGPQKARVEPDRPQEATQGVDHLVPGIDERDIASLAKGLDLSLQLPRMPEVVAVDEGDQLPRSRP